MGTEVRTVPTNAHQFSHAEKPVHLLRVAFAKIAAEHAMLSREDVLALAVHSVNSMKTSTGLSLLRLIAVVRPDTPLCQRSY
jgi:integral membrane sensor domain MASE1